MSARRLTIRNFTFPTLTVILFIAILFTMNACGSNTSNQKSTQEKSENETLIVHHTTENAIFDPDNDDLFANILDPAIAVRGVKARRGDKNVEVLIEIKNNPGIWGMDFDLYYDSSAVTLVSATSVLDLEGCCYTPPAYYRNPTSFLWDFQDACWSEDGTLLKLYFDIAEDTPLGEHELKIMYSYGNIFDADGNPIDIKVKNAHILIED